MAEKIKIHVFRCGKTGVDPAVLDRSLSRNPMAYTGLFRPWSKRIWLPVRAYLIEHPKGKVLINTGWNANVRKHPYLTLGPMAYVATPYLPDGESIGERLEALQIDPKDLDLVLLTHLESDAVGGLNEVKEARRIAVCRDEWLDAHSILPRYNVNSNFWNDIQVKTFEISDKKSEDSKEERFRDVFGDGSVRVVPLPGRTAGMVGVKVSFGKQFVFIVGDAAYFKNSWQMMSLPGPANDILDAALTLDYIKTQSEDPNCVAVLASHDPAAQPDLIELGRRANFFYSGNRTNKFEKKD